MTRSVIQKFEIRFLAYFRLKTQIFAVSRGTISDLGPF